MEERTVCMESGALKRVPAYVLLAGWLAGRSPARAARAGRLFKEEACAYGTLISHRANCYRTAHILY